MKRKITLTALTDLRDGRFLFALCCILYGSIYFGRLNLAAAITEITTTGILEKDVAGLIHTVFFAVYAVGQLINGFLSDRLSPFSLIVVSLSGSAVANLVMFWAMSSSAPFWCFLLIWGVNGFAQSAVYPTLIRLVSGVLPEKMRISSGSILFAAAAIGIMCSNLLCAGIMKVWSWEFCFLMPAAFLAMLALVWFVLTRKISAKTLAREVIQPVEEEAKEETKSSGHGLLYYMAVSGGFVMMPAIAAFYVVKESITVWSPTLLTEIFSADPSFTVALSTVISLASIFGAMLAQLVFTHWLHDEMKSIAFFNFSVGIGLILVLTVGMKSIWAMLILLSLILVLLTSVNTLFMGIIPLRFGRFGVVSTVTGLLNCIGAGGCAAASYVTGLVAEIGGWNNTVLLWLGLTVIGLLAELLLIPRWMRFKQM